LSILTLNGSTTAEEEVTYARNPEARVTLKARSRLTVWLTREARNLKPF
jgi:hypothetical protein